MTSNKATFRIYESCALGLLYTGIEVESKEEAIEWCRKFNDRTANAYIQYVWKMVM